MSTRCQVKVVQEGLEWQEAISLYHHSDGYPDNIIPLLREAFKLCGQNYQAGRAGKAASFICAVDPGNFEPEDNHQLHGDIEYYYLVHLINKHNGTLAEVPDWMVEVYEPRSGFFNLKCPQLKNMKKTDTFNF
jgi:hypothetical protein